MAGIEGHVEAPTCLHASPDGLHWRSISLKRRESLGTQQLSLTN